MSWQSAARRLRQLPLLLDAPPQLRRAHERHPVDRTISVQVDDRECGHHTIDVSHGGLLVEPPVSAHTGQTVLVSVGALLNNVPATVVCHRNGGTALQFQSVSHGALLTAWLLKD